MNLPNRPKSHLVERAVEALGGAGTLGLRPPPAPPGAPPAPAAPATPAPGPASPEARPPAPAAGAAPQPAPATAPQEAKAPERPAAPAFIGIDVLRHAGLVLAPAGAGRSRMAEEFSVVQHALLRTMRAMDAPVEGSGRMRRVILVTSARPGEGKTFSTLNLAASMAAGRTSPVVLVDADGKQRGSLSELLGLADAPGLRLLAGEPQRDPDALLVPTELRGLFVLPFGRPVPGGPEVPPGATVAAAIQHLAAALPQHVFLLDAPPCLSTSDPSSLAPVAGQVLLVVEAERTKRPEVEAALDLVEACPILQLMLNKTRLTVGETFGAYDNYGGYGPYGAARPEA